MTRKRQRTSLCTLSAGQQRRNPRRQCHSGRCDDRSRAAPRCAFRRPHRWAVLLAALSLRGCSVTDSAGDDTPAIDDDSMHADALELANGPFMTVGLARPRQFTRGEAWRLQRARADGADGPHCLHGVKLQVACSCRAVELHSSNTLSLTRNNAVVLTCKGDALWCVSIWGKLPFKV